MGKKRGEVDSFSTFEKERELEEKIREQKEEKAKVYRTNACKSEARIQAIPIEGNIRFLEEQLSNLRSKGGNRSYCKAKCLIEYSDGEEEVITVTIKDYAGSLDRDHMVLGKESPLGETIIKGKEGERRQFSAGNGRNSVYIMEKVDYN